MNITCDKCDNGTLMLIKQRGVDNDGYLGPFYRIEQECPVCGRRLLFSLMVQELSDGDAGARAAQQAKDDARHRRFLVDTHGGRKA